MRPGIALIGRLVCLLAGIWIACALPAQAATTERIVVNRFSGVAIEGFDPVAYFVDGRPLRGLLPCFMEILNRFLRVPTATVVMGQLTVMILQGGLVQRFNCLRCALV